MDKAMAGFALRLGRVIGSVLTAAAWNCCTKFRAGPYNSFPGVRCIDIRTAICG